MRIVGIRGMGLGVVLLCLAGCGSSSISNKSNQPAASQRSLLHVTGALSVDVRGTGEIEDNCSVVGGSVFTFEVFHPSGGYQARFDLHAFRGLGRYIVAGSAAPPVELTVFKYVSPDQRPSWRAKTGTIVVRSFDKAQQRASGTVEATLLSTTTNSDAIQVEGSWTCIHTESGDTWQTQGL